MNINNDVLINCIKIGKITKTHGIKGELSAVFYSDDYKTLINYQKFYIDNDNEIKIIFKSKPNYHITNDKSTSDIKLVIGVQEVNDIETAKIFINKDIYINKSEIIVKENEFLISDLIGLPIYQYNEDNCQIGTIKDVHDFGAGAIIEWLTNLQEYKKYSMLAFNDETFPKVDLLERKVYLDINNLE